MLAVQSIGGTHRDHINLAPQGLQHCPVVGECFGTDIATQAQDGGIILIARCYEASDLACLYGVPLSNASTTHETERERIPGT
jgi:hypothetical protein